MFWLSFISGHVQEPLSASQHPHMPSAGFMVWYSVVFIDEDVSVRSEIQFLEDH